MPSVRSGRKAPGNNKVHERHSPPAIDRVVFLERIGRDQELALGLIDLYLRNSGDMLSAVSAGVRGRDSESLERAAHQLKGALGILGAKAAAGSALTLERMARNGDLAALDDPYARLASDMALFEIALANLRHEVYQNLASPQRSF